MKFTLRLLKSLLIFFFVCIPLQLVSGIILLPVCYYLKSTRLPKVLRWFDNADTWVGRDDSVYLTVLASGWWNNYCWLAWRNPLNYFGYKVLGCNIQNSPITLSDGNPNVGNTTEAGYFHQELSNGYYQYYYVKKWSSTKCLRFRLGWKFSTPNAIPGWYQFAFTFQPWLDYTGI